MARWWESACQCRRARVRSLIEEDPMHAEQLSPVHLNLGWLSTQGNHTSL